VVKMEKAMATTRRDPGHPLMTWYAELYWKHLLKRCDGLYIWGYMPSCLLSCCVVNVDRTKIAALLIRREQRCGKTFRITTTQLLHRGRFLAFLQDTCAYGCEVVSYACNEGIPLFTCSAHDAACNHLLLQILGATASCVRFSGQVSSFHKFPLLT